MTRTTATFERAGDAVTATYLGERAWTIATGRTPAAGEEKRADNGSVGRTIRDCLRLTEPLPSGTRIEVRASNVRHGVLSNNTFPPTAWWFDIDPGAGGVAPDLDAAIWECLSALHLSPSRRAGAPARFVDPRFGFAALCATPDPDGWATELARCGQQWLGADAALDDVYAFIDQLRALGHPLYSYDEDDDFVTWATWGPERPPRCLFVDVRLPSYEAPVVTVTVNAGGTAT